MATLHGMHVERESALPRGYDKPLMYLLQQILVWV